MLTEKQVNYDNNRVHLIYNFFVQVNYYKFYL